MRSVHDADQDLRLPRSLPFRSTVPSPFAKDEPGGRPPLVHCPAPRLFDKCGQIKKPPVSEWLVTFYFLLLTSYFLRARSNSHPEERAVHEDERHDEERQRQPVGQVGALLGRQLHRQFYGQ